MIARARWGKGRMQTSAWSSMLVVVYVVSSLSPARADILRLDYEGFTVWLDCEQRGRLNSATRPLLALRRGAAGGFHHTRGLFLPPPAWQQEDQGKGHYR
jgi:hypothetical protein